MTAKKKAIEFMAIASRLETTKDIAMAIAVELLKESGNYRPYHWLKVQMEIKAIELDPKARCATIDKNKDGCCLHDISGFYDCPACKQNDLVEKDNYCSNCGIKINWIE